MFEASESSQYRIGEAMNRKDRGKTRNIVVGIALFAAVFFIFGCGASILDSSNIMSSEAGLKPGLSVVYVHGFWRNLYQMPGEEKARKTGFKGEPIPNLNHRFGKGVNLFDSGRPMGIGLYLDGFIKFDDSGIYEFKANTNDGFRLTIAGEKIIEDSEMHSDRFSNTVTVTVSKAGWYPVQIQYFQRKGTATIELYWKRPGDAEKSIIPPEAFAHAS